MVTTHIFYIRQNLVSTTYNNFKVKSKVISHCVVTCYSIQDLGDFSHCEFLKCGTVMRQVKVRLTANK